MISDDAHVMMLFEANKKSTAVGYALWFFLGLFGAHRFYTGRNGSAVAMLIALFVGLAFPLVLGGLLIWWVIDAFLLSGWIASTNTALIGRLKGSPGAQA